MFGKSIKLFTLLGFEVRVDASWIVIALLVTWSLAVGFFPAMLPDLSRATYWVMGIAGALGLFLSIILHEFAHSIVARRYGIPMKGITLFIFGGVAHMGEEPPNPKSEFLMAIAGPIMSLVIAGACYGLMALGQTAGWPGELVAILGYLGFINLVVVVFNLIPAFPLDGGRVLRSALWAWKKRVKWATRIASRAGSIFGLILVFLGILNVIGGNFIGGFWLFLIGLFLRSAAQMSYQQLEVRQALEGEPVSRFMHAHPITVSPPVTLRQFTEDYVYQYHHKMFPVAENSKLLGLVSLDEVKKVPPEKRDQVSVAEVMVPPSNENTIMPEEDAVEALSKMNRGHLSKLLVVQGERLAGILSLRDLQKFLALKIELEDAEQGANA
jgi:Zn-dependent protease/predicted transcriptional regulator